MHTQKKSYNLEILFTDNNNNMCSFPPLGPLCEEELVYPAPSHPALQENWIKNININLHCTVPSFLLACALHSTAFHSISYLHVHCTVLPFTQSATCVCTAQYCLSLISYLHVHCTVLPFTQSATCVCTAQYCFQTGLPWPGYTSSTSFLMSLVPSPGAWACRDFHWRPQFSAGLFWATFLPSYVTQQFTRQDRRLTWTRISSGWSCRSRGQPRRGDAGSPLPRSSSRWHPRRQRSWTEHESVSYQPLTHLRKSFLLMWTLKSLPPPVLTASSHPR